jgi:hypothetical protein
VVLIERRFLSGDLPELPEDNVLDLSKKEIRSQSQGEKKIIVACM